MNAAPLDLLITDGEVFTLDPSFTVHRGGAVGIRGGSIAGVWAAGGVPQVRASRVIDAGGCAVLPGLVNAHTHLAGCVFRGVLDEGVGGQGLYRVGFPMEQRLTRDDIVWLGRLGIIEVLLAGCTTVNDIYYFPDALATAAEEAGIRAVLANKIFDADLPAIGGGVYRRDVHAGLMRLRENETLIERWHGAAGGRISCRVGTHATDTCSIDLLREGRRLANETGVGLHIHVAQSSREVDHVVSTHGCSPVRYLEGLDFLGPDVIAVHCTRVEPSDIAVLAQTQTRYAHCPTMYPRRGYYPPFRAIQEAGVVTGFGTDWIRMDPWDGMRQAMNAVRLLTEDPDALQAREALAFFTIEAARILGLEAEIGSLEPGKRADAILVDLQRPHLQPFYGSAAGLVYNVNGSDVETVIVDGRVVVEHGRCLTLDAQQTLGEVVARIPGYELGLRQLVEAAQSAGEHQIH
ncbi:MAG: amidohydrolase family protein [Armatimonadota bacterium]